MGQPHWCGAGPELLPGSLWGSLGPPDGLRCLLKGQFGVDRGEGLGLSGSVVGRRGEAALSWAGVRAGLLLSVNSGPRGGGGTRRRGPERLNSSSVPASHSPRAGKLPPLPPAVTAPSEGHVCSSTGAWGLGSRTQVSQPRALGGPLPSFYRLQSLGLIVWILLSSVVTCISF